MGRRKKEEPIDLNASQEQVLELAMGEIKKRENNDLAVGYYNSLPRLKGLDVIPTGSINLDRALGVGGVARGRVVEIFGPESSGKTTLCLHIIANAQKMGLKAAFIDMEHALDPAYAEAIGVNMDNLIIAQPNSGSEAIRTIATLAKSGSVAVIVTDSVASMSTEEEVEKQVTDNSIGMQARLMSQALRILSPTIAKSNTCVIFTNQIRMKIGIMFGNPETTPGGNALKFYSSQRLEIRRTGPIKDSDSIIGAETRVKVVKNKVAPPFKEARFNIIYGEGIDSDSDLLKAAVELKIVEKAGAWYAYKDEKIGQGELNTVGYLKGNPEVHAEIERRVRNFFDQETDPKEAPDSN